MTSVKANKIFIVGMPASGKTTLAKLLAQKMGLDFFDLDELIERQTQNSIRNIFKEKGENYFRELESSKLKLWIAENNNFVLACGGGTPCFLNNMKLMNENGITIFLECAPEEIYERIKNSNEQRPLLLYTNDAGLLLSIEKLNVLRKKFYTRAQIKIDVQHKLPEQIATEISDQLK